MKMRLFTMMIHNFSSQLLQILNKIFGIIDTLSHYMHRKLTTVNNKGDHSHFGNTGSNQACKKSYLYLAGNLEAGNFRMQEHQTHLVVPKLS